MKEINLIPKDIRFVIRWSYRRVVLVTAIPFILSMLFTWAFQLHAVSIYSNQMKRDEEVLHELTAMRMEMVELIKDVEKISLQKQVLSNMADIMRSYLKDRIIWSDVIGDICNKYFPGLWMHKLRVKEVVKKDSKNRERRIKKMILRGNSVNTEDIAKLLNFMESYPLFDKVVLYQGDRESLGERFGYKFIINCEVVQ